MAALLFRRFLRYCRNNVFLFSALTVLVTAVVSIVVVLEGTAYTITDGRENNKDIECIEDGQFTTRYELSDEQIRELSEKHGVTIQKNYSKDIQQDNVLFRVFKPREKIDVFIPDEGSFPEYDDEIAIEQIYARENGIKTGDTIYLDGRYYTVCGIGSIPDYTHPSKNSSDVGISPTVFACVFLSDESYDRIDGYPETYTYAFISGENTVIKDFCEAIGNIEPDKNNYLYSDEAYVRFIESVPVKNFDFSIPVLISFTETKNNLRMNYEIKYAELYKTMGYTVGIMLIVMLAFIFAIVTKNQIRNEHCIIGSLYALGISKRTVLAFYIFPNVLISFIGGILGLILGYMPFMTGTAIAAFHHVNSFPYYEYSRPVEVLFYALIMPPLINLLINCTVLNNTLSNSALSLIRGTYENIKNIKLRINTGNFIKNIQIRRFLREKNTPIVFCSIFCAVVLFMLGLTTKFMIKNNEKYAENTSYNSICIVKYPVFNLETKGEKIYIENVSAVSYDREVPFSVVGIPENSRFYSINPENSGRFAIASSSLASKMNLTTGSKFTFRDNISQKEYTVTITGITDTVANLELYMNIDRLCSLTNKYVGYYNAIIFANEPDIDDCLIYSVADKSEIIKGIASTEVSVSAFINLSFILSTVIFISTLYLIVSTMIDKSTAGISLVRVFGYRTTEIRKMYLNAIIYPVVIALVISFPIAKLFVDKVSPYIYIEMAMGMFFDIPIKYYFAVFIVAMLLFALILLALTVKIGRIKTSVILKTRE